MEQHCLQVTSTRIQDQLEEPAISIVLATKGNKLAFLKNCLNSLKSQTFRDFEIILVYTIYSEELEEIISLSHLRALKDDSSTLASARNLGLKHAKGGIVGFIDDDCEAPNDWLAKIYTKFQEYPNLACLGGAHLTPIQELKKNPFNFVQGSFVESRMGQKISIDRSAVGKIAGCNVMYRKKFFAIVGYLNEKLRSGEDWEFHIRFCEFGYNLIFDPKIFVWHHRQGLKHVFSNSSRMVPFYLSRRTLRYAKYESFFASFYITNIAFILLFILLFISPLIFCIFVIVLLLGQFSYAAIRTKTYSLRALYYPLQIVITVTQIIAFYFGLIKYLVAKVRVS